MPQDKVGCGSRLFVEIQLKFRYGVDNTNYAEEPFQQIAVIASTELFPGDDQRREKVKPNAWEGTNQS